MRSTSRKLQVVILALVAICGEPMAQAEKKVVIFNFAGPGGAKARRGVIRAMAQQVTFERVDNFLAEGDMAGVNPVRGKGLVTTCTRTKVDAVIKGKVTRRKRGRYTVTVSVVNGGTGVRLGRRAATVKGTRRLIRAGAAIGKLLLPMVQEAEHAAIKPVKRAAPRPAPVFKPRPRKKKKKKKGMSLKGLFDVSVSMGISKRNYKLEGADPTLDRAYEGGVYPEFTLRLDLFPMAPFMDNFVRNIGLSVSYTRHLSVSTKMTTKQGEVEVDTGSQELLLDLMVRWPIFKKATSPVILGHVGYGFRNFSLGENYILPSFKYNFVRIGLGGRVPLTTPLIALEAGFDVRPLISVGQDAVDAFGQKEGGFSWSVRGGLSGRTSLGLFYGATFEYLAFTTDFGGRYDITGNGPPLVRKDPTNGSDGFIRFWLTIGYGM
jgi:hypothetical protein